MSPIQTARLGLIALSTVVLASCGGGGDTTVQETPIQQSTSAYLQTLPKWDQYSPAAQAVDTKVGQTGSQPETVDNVPVYDESSPTDPATGLKPVIGYRSEDYDCTSTKYSMTSTPEKIVMFSPDREILWPGAMIQGRSHRFGVGSMLPLVIRERAPIKVSIPSLAKDDNFRVVNAPDQAEVNQAIGLMISGATQSALATPSTIQFTMSDFNSEKSFALKANMSGRYMGFQASASGGVSTRANERTVMVYFIEKMFEVVVEPPQSPGAFFSDGFTRDKLDEQIALGRLGPDNPPLYVSNIVYGRMMAFTLTSSANMSDIQAALNASYKGVFAKFDASVNARHVALLQNSKISVTSLGGESAATTAVIASGDWSQYFKSGAKLTSAYPLSYTLRNLADGSIAKVSESTDYDIRECALKSAAFSGFVLDSFETDFSDAAYPAARKWSPAATVPVTVDWGAANTPQSIFYGYLAASHVNELDNGLFKFDVGYIKAPAHFLGNKADFYQGELSFWFKPAEALSVSGTTTKSEVQCHWVIWPFWKECDLVSEPVEFSNATLLTQADLITAYDDFTAFDRVLMRGGGAEDSNFAVLTLTYNPKAQRIPFAWARQVVAMTNHDRAGESLCETIGSHQLGCWLIEDRPATEAEIRYVLANVRELQLRASYPVSRQMNVCARPVYSADGTTATCPDGQFTDKFVPIGYIGGYFDEIQITKKSPGL